MAVQSVTYCLLLIAKNQPIDSLFHHSSFFSHTSADHSVYGYNIRTPGYFSVPEEFVNGSFNFILHAHIADYDISREANYNYTPEDEAWAANYPRIYLTNEFQGAILEVELSVDNQTLTLSSTKFLVRQPGHKERKKNYI